MAAPFCHVEIPVRNVARAKKFYGGVFGWKFRQFAPHYVMYTTGEGIGGALAKKDVVAGEGGVIFYLKVADMKTALDAAKKAGAQVILKRTKIDEENGFIAHIRDTEGNVLGLWSQD